MKLSSVQEAIDCNDDDPVLAIRGTLTKLYDPMTGEGQHGDWSIQNGTLKDGTGEIKLFFSNREAVPKNYQGKVIELRCAKGQKGGYSGVKRITDKKDKKTPKLEVSDKAEVILYDKEHEPEPNGAAKGPSKAQEPPREPADTKPPLQRQLQSEAAPRVPSWKEDLDEGMGLIIRMLNFQLATITLVREYLMPMVKERTRKEIGPEQESALVQNVLIQGYRDQIHTKFPTKRYPVKQNGLSTDPPPEPPT